MLNLEIKKTMKVGISTYSSLHNLIDEQISLDQAKIKENFAAFWYTE